MPWRERLTKRAGFRPRFGSGAKEKVEMMNAIKTFLRDESGMEFSEYVVASVLITLAVVSAFTDVGSAIVGKITILTGYIIN
jgi:Flp pilus assembly pilin Flp